jgi:hypothetical protein
MMSTVDLTVEWILPKQQGLEAVELATEAQVAVLGVQHMEVCGQEVRLAAFTRYRYEFSGDWTGFVRQNNRAAARFLADKPDSDNSRYIMTSVPKDSYSPSSTGKLKGRLTLRSIQGCSQGSARKTSED